MNQYNEGKSGDDGANAIMEAATDLQEILEEKKSPRLVGFFFGRGCLLAEPVSIPLQCFLCLYSFVVPLVNNDVFSHTWQGIGRVYTVHFKTGRGNIGHFFRGIGVT